MPTGRSWRSRRRPACCSARCCCAARTAGARRRPASSTRAPGLCAAAAPLLWKQCLCVAGGGSALLPLARHMQSLEMLRTTRDWTLWGAPGPGTDTCPSLHVITVTVCCAAPRRTHKPGLQTALLLLGAPAVEAAGRCRACCGRSDRGRGWAAVAEAVGFLHKQEPVVSAPCTAEARRSASWLAL